MFLFLTVFLSVVIAYILKFHYEYVRAFYLSLKIDGPRAYPLVGNGLMFINKTSDENFRNITNVIRDYGEFIRIWLGPDLMILVSDPKDSEILLSNPKYIDKSDEYRFIKPWLNEGLLLSKGQKWHDRRKAITPAFHFKILEEFVEVFDRIGNTVVNTVIKKYDQTDEIEIYPIAVLYALDVMCETAMGVSVDALSKPNSQYVMAVKEIAYCLFTRMTDFILRYECFYVYSDLYKRQNHALGILHGFTDDVIRQRRFELKNIQINNNKNADNNVINDDIGIRKKEALLDLLLKSTINGKSLTDFEIREEVDTFMFEGHDTTTSAITFTLFNVARYPKVQKMCFNEIRKVFGDDKTTPTTIHHLSELHYLDLVIKETLRLYPSVPFIARKANEDIHLSKDRVVPAGSNVVVSVYNMQRDARNYENPNEFQPERFMETKTAEIRNPFAYIPFSAGPRNCIGQKFAILEIKSIISKILRHYDVHLSKDSDIEPVLSAELILRPDSSILFSMKPRLYS